MCGKALRNLVEIKMIGGRGGTRTRGPCLQSRCSPSAYLHWAEARIVFV
jgi:hypothetical protein